MERTAVSRETRGCRKEASNSFFGSVMMIDFFFMRRRWVGERVRHCLAIVKAGLKGGWIGRAHAFFEGCSASRMRR